MRSFLNSKAHITRRVSFVCGFLLLFAVYVHRIYFGDDDPYHCSALLNKGQWLESTTQSWQPSGCMLHQYRSPDIRDCIGQRKALFIGDSTVRQLFWATARKSDANAAATLESKGEKHSDVDFQSSAGGVRLQFMWDPYLNSTILPDLLQELRADTNEAEEMRVTDAFIVVGGGLWHARYLKDEGLDAFSKSVENIVRLVNRSDSHQSLTPGGTAFPRRRLLLLPVLEPDYVHLDAKRATTMTRDRLLEINRHLEMTALVHGIPLLRVMNGIASSGSRLYNADGVHLTQGVSDVQSNIVLNYFCNEDRGRKGYYPNDGTCCSRYSGSSLRQDPWILGSLILIAYLSAVRRVRNTRYGNLNGAAFLAIALAIIYCKIADRTVLFDKLHKQFALNSLFVFGFLGGLVLGIPRVLFYKDGVSETTGRAALSRQQTDEWKGWMQYAILVYHYIGASQDVQIYEFIRILVASYLFLTGYGHTLFFLRKRDYSFRRVVMVLFRLNFLSCILSYAMHTDYLFYYFSPLSSFWFLVVYYTMKPGHKDNHDFVFLTFKIIISAVLVTCVTKLPGVLEAFFRLLKVTCNIHWNVKEWRFRVALDLFIVYIGMLAAALYDRLIPEIPGTITAKEADAHRALSAILYRCRVFIRLLQIIIISTPFVLLLTPFGTPLAPYFTTKPAYTSIHAYLSPLPILAHIFLITTIPLLRDTCSPIFEFLGRISLETFTLQFHIWLAADTKGVLSTGFFPQEKGWSRWADFAVLTPLFLVVSWWVAGATEGVMGWFVGSGKRELPVVERKDSLIMNGEKGKEKWTLREKVKGYSTKGIHDLRVRVVLVFGVMWCVNMFLYSGKGL